MFFGEMSFQEKRAWISQITMGLIYGRYFWAVTMQGGRGPFGNLLATVIMLVVLQVGIITLAAILNPREASAARDEREQLIELKSARVAYAGLSTGVACACFFGAMNPPIIFNVNSLLFVLVTAEMLRNACQIVMYRRGLCA